MRIQFEIYIPFRIQQELTELLTFIPSKAPSERFKVYIFHGFHCPVTFVELLNIHDRYIDPSRSVIVLREFLRYQSLKSHSEYIEFQFLGPSPFHIEFFVEEPENQDEEAPWFFWHKKLEIKGYNHIIFYYDKQQFENIDEAKIFIMREILDELSFFYSINQIENKRSDRWEQITSKLEKVIEIQKARGMISLVKRYFSFRQLNDLFFSVIQFESDDISYSEDIQTGYRDIYTSQPNISLKEYIDREISDRSSFPTRQLMELIALFEKQREKLSESIIIRLMCSQRAACGIIDV